LESGKWKNGDNNGLAKYCALLELLKIGSFGIESVVVQVTKVKAGVEVG